MTRDEIKNTPELVDHLLDESVIADSRKKLYKRMDEICNLAIKALEQETCEDCIIRQAVIDEIFRSHKNFNNEFDQGFFADKIRALPSVNQQPRIGHWIKTPGMNEQCDVCGSFFPLSDFARRPFEINHCPACGVKMVEPQERNDKKMTKEQQYWKETQEALTRIFDRCEEIDLQSGYDMLEDIQFIRGFINKHKPQEGSDKE